MNKKLISFLLVFTFLFAFLFIGHVKLTNKTTTLNQVKVTDVYPPIWIPDTVPAPTPSTSPQG